MFKIDSVFGQNICQGNPEWTRDEQISKAAC